jgi:hypothetical protein
VSSNTIPNLDCSNIDELRAFALKYRKTNLDNAAYLIGDHRKGFSLLAKKLSKYAEYKALAMECRLEGSVDRALDYENRCERLYEGLKISGGK